MEWKLSGKNRGWLLDRMRTTNDARECRRCSALLRLDEGHSVCTVAQEFGVSRQTVHNWRNRLPASTAGGLQDKPRSGRPSVWTDDRVQTLERLLDDSPREHGFYAVGWTAGLLKLGLQQQHDFAVSGYALRQKLHELDYVWKRSRYTLKPDPQREKKKTYPQSHP